MAETGAASDLSPAGAQNLTPAQRLKCIVGGSAGNLVEWFDWFAYASFSIYFSKVFFPDDDQTTQFLKAAVIYAVGFFARPVGAWLMGLYADHAGRRAALTLSVSMMCGGSLIIGCIPGPDMIGLAAPVVLVLARILQGLSVGGEYGASATYVSEMSGRHNRGFWSGFLYVTLIMGQLLALGLLILLQSILTEEQLYAWGWRVPFFIGAALAVVVFWIRRGIDESRSYTDAREAGHERARTMMLFTRYPRETLIIVALTAGGSLGFYAYTTYMQKFLVNTSGFSKDTATLVMAAALFCFMCAQPLFGALSDRVGRKVMMIGSFALGSVCAFPIFSAIAKVDDPLIAFLLCLIPLMILSGYTSISAIIKAELFPAHVRALGVALPFALANAVFGGTAEQLALWFKKSGSESHYYIYVAAVMAVAFLVAIRMRDTAKTSLILED